MKLWIVLFALVSLANCKRASYEESRERKDETKEVAPPKPVINVGVEVVYQGQVIKETTINTEVNVRPTAASIFDMTAPSCPNKGFTRIEYDFGDGQKAAVERPSGCEEPSTRHVYTKPGTYMITMRMIAKDNTTYLATTTLLVHPLPTVNPNPIVTSPTPPTGSDPIVDYWVPCDPCANNTYYQYDPCDPCAGYQRQGFIGRFFSRFRQ